MQCYNYNIVYSSEARHPASKIKKTESAKAQRQLFHFLRHGWGDFCGYQPRDNLFLVVESTVLSHEEAQYTVNSSCTDSVLDACFSMQGLAPNLSYLIMSVITESLEDLRGDVLMLIRLKTFSDAAAAVRGSVKDFRAIDTYKKQKTVTNMLFSVQQHC